MLFNSIDFALFLPVVFILYWFVTNRNLVLQNLLLLVSSYYFYGSWDYRFLFLLIFSTLLDFYTGLKMYDSKSHRLKKMWLLISVCVNLGFLGLFKYYNFFIDSFTGLLSLFGLKTNLWTINVILPVGISFYTFHGLSYVFDIYNNKIKPVRNFIEYSVFVSFFPLLVAGPIERATHLLPQVQKKRYFDYAKATDGLKQILWGLFKKIVIADNCATYANMIFNNSNDYSGSTLLLGSLFFAFQIYCDFSGYSDIAIGSAKLFGIDLLRNFAFPYFARDIAEFWRRWHISLTTWFRDYLYIPLGGSKGGTWMKVRNTFIIFLVSGFWHGANWTFIAWGALNAIYFVPLLLSNRNRKNLDTVAQDRVLPSLNELVNMGITFSLTLFAWIFFRAENIGHALSYIAGIFSKSIIHKPELPVEGYAVLALIFLFLILEWFSRKKIHAFEMSNLPIVLKWSVYLFFGFVILLAFDDKPDAFIYFQF